MKCHNQHTRLCSPKVQPWVQNKHARMRKDISMQVVLQQRGNLLSSSSTGSSGGGSSSSGSDSSSGGGSSSCGS